MVSPVTSTELLSLALDAALLRQQAIAQNIANANTPGYRPLSVRFDELLVQERQQLLQGGKLSLTSLAAYTPQLVQSEEAAPVVLDEQATQLAGNVFHHQVLLRAITKQFALMNLAANDGKR
jgi:flagellar basal-body rod protein FlgB